MSGMGQAGLILLATSVLAKVVGFLREAVIAASYGTSHTVDVYLAGMTLPALATTVVFYSIPNAFVPLFAVTSPHSHARWQAWGVLGFMCLVSGGLWWLAGPIASLTNSGFPEPLRAESVVVLQITSGAIALATVEAIARSRLLAHRRFFRPGLSLILQSAVMIAVIWLYTDAGPRTLAWGFVAGNVAAALWNLLPVELLQKRATQVPEVDKPSSPDHGRVGLWIAIILLADTIPQMYAIIDRHLASHLPEGSIAALQYAGLIANTPTSICGFALSSAVFPYLVKALERQDRRGAADILDRTVSWSLIMTVPAMIWLVIFRQEITLLLYERGAFDEASRLLTASTLMAYALGVVPNVMAAILSRVFYSSRQWAPIMLSASVSVAVKATLSFWLGRHGTTGLAAASTAGSVFAAAVFLSALPREFTNGRWQVWSRNALALSVICGAGTLAAIGLASLLPVRSSALLAIFELVCAVLVSSAIVYWAGPHMGLREINVLKHSITRTTTRSRAGRRGMCQGSRWG